MIQPWTATCVQVLNHTVNHAKNRDEAMEIVHRSLDRWEILILGGIAPGQARPNNPNQLLLFPEFALQGFPILESTAEWIDKACFEIPGPETERLQKIAQQHRIFIAANSYERDADWPDIYFNCSYLIDTTGDIILKYRRINTLHSVSPHDLMERYLEIEKDRSFIKGQKYTLLSRKKNLTLAGRQALKKLLDANKRLHTAYLLKESFGQLWEYQTEGWARRFFENWKAALKWQRLKPFEDFAEMIERHWDGIAAYAKPENKVSLGFVEGLNNKIRVIQRRASGLRDEKYLRLKVLTCMLKPI